MYVSNFADNGFGNPGTVSRIDTTQSPPAVIGSPIEVGIGPSDITYDPIHQTMYVANSQSGTVSVIDTTQNPPAVTGIPITVGTGPVFIAYDPINQQMYVTNEGPGGMGGTTVSVIDTNSNTVINTITVGNTPTGIAYDEEHHRMYVANAQSDTVSVINLC
jgi:YVTN family beta-propeller protein